MIHELTKKYEWDGIEFEHMEKSVDWYWGLGIVVVTGCVISIVFGNYLLAVLLALGGGMLAFYANDRPEHVHVELSERGIKLNRDLFTHESIKSFWMYKDHRDRERIIIMTGGKVMPQRIITLPEALSPTEIRSYLLEYVEEKELKPSAIDVVAETLGL